MANTFITQIHSAEKEILLSVLFNTTKIDRYYALDTLNLIDPNVRFDVYTFSKIFPDSVYFTGHGNFPFGPLLFKHKKHIDLFFKEYNTNELIPFGLPSGKINGSVVEDCLEKYDNKNDIIGMISDPEQQKINVMLAALKLLDKWAWIKQNTKKPVRRIPGGWFFSSNTDATFFKLKFIG